MLSRAGVKGNRKLILVLIQERTLLLVSGCIESSAFSLSLSSCSFSLAFSLVLLPSFFLSLLLVLAFLPSFLPWNVTRSLGKCTQNKSAVIVRICIIVGSRKNLHTCKLPLAGSRSPLVKYAQGSHIGFCFPSHHFGRPCWRRHGSGRVWLGDWYIFLQPQGAFSPGFYPLSRGVGLIGRRLKRL